MQFRHIMKSLKDDYTISVCSEQNTDKINDIQLLDPLAESYDPQVLYVADKHAVSTCKSFPLHLVASCNPADFPTENNFALIQEEDFFAVFNTLHTLFYQSLQISSDFSQLIAMSIRGDSAQEIVNAASKKLGNPLIIIDNGFKVLFHSDIWEIQDTLWRENISRGYCTYEFITAVNQISDSLKAPDNSSAYTFTCPASPHSKLCSKIFWNGSQIGYAIMLEEQTPYNIIQQEMLPHVSYVLSDVLSKLPAFSGLHGSLKSILLYQLLDQQPQENIAIRIKSSGITPPKFMCCLSISHDTLPDTKQWERFASEQLLRLLPDASVCTYEQRLIALVPVKDMFGPSKEVLVSLQELLPKISRNIYISQPYDDIYMTRAYYHQCTFLQKFALQMDFSGKILSYGDYQFYDLLEQISDKSRLYAYIPPALGILKEYDRKNGTSLFETLETYIHCQYNATKTASALFIHRNSLSYRMEKIEELTRIDYNDTNQLFHLAVGFYMEHYLSNS